MKIEINQDEIKRAIIDFVDKQGITITGKNVDVTLVAGRSPAGMSATIDISNDLPSETASDKPAPPNKKTTASRKKKEEPVSSILPETPPAQEEPATTPEPYPLPAAEEPPFDTDADTKTVGETVEEAAAEPAAEEKPLFGSH